jgi:hypothetical protein
MSKSASKKASSEGSTSSCKLEEDDKLELGVPTFSEKFSLVLILGDIDLDIIFGDFGVVSLAF